MFWLVAVVAVTVTAQIAFSFHVIRWQNWAKARIEELSDAVNLPMNDDPDRET